MPATHKKCSGCGRNKSLDDYREQAAGKLGRRSQCRACEREKQREARSESRQQEEYQRTAKAISAAQVAAAQAEASGRSSRLAVVAAVLDTDAWARVVLAQIDAARRGSQKAAAQLDRWLTELEAAASTSPADLDERRKKLVIAAMRTIMSNPRGSEVALQQLREKCGIIRDIAEADAAELADMERAAALDYGLGGPGNAA